MKPPLLNLRHLKAVAATARTGSVSAAARLVYLTQPAITQAIAKLEETLGVPLFMRGPLGMATTEATVILLPRIEAALHLVGSSRVTAPQMRAFIALARSGSYAGAASALRLSEPSLHRAVADLSLSLEYKLVERRGRGIALTSRGTALARRFRLAEAELRAGVAEVETLKGREIGRIAIGAMPLSRARLLPNAIGAFHRGHPKLDITVLEGSYTDLVGPLRDGEIDMMVGALRPDAAGDLAQQPLFEDRPVILARAGHVLTAGPREPTVEQLAGFDWILPAEGTPLRAQWRRMFETSGIAPPRVAVQCGSVMVVRQLLIQGDFLTLLSPDQVAVELEAGWLARVGPAPGQPSRIIGVTTRAEWRPTVLQRRFVELLEAEGRLVSERQD